MAELKLTSFEIAVLRKLVNGEAVSIPSQQRIRLELAGMIREGAEGIALTPSGRSLALQKPVDNVPPEAARSIKVVRDVRGRRLPFQRKFVF
jgi:hypothetical protein